MTLWVRTGVESGQNVRDRQPPADSTVIATVLPDDSLEVLNDFETALAELYLLDKWLKIRTPQGVEGYCASWLLLPEKATHLPGLNDREAGCQRALDTAHTPVFVGLPVDLQQLTYFNGFGPNNFAFIRQNTEIYRFTCRIHSGIDFGLPQDGCNLYALDWGVVLWVSQNPTRADNPWGALPYSVIIRYGQYAALYGHMSEPGQVAVGDVVYPGQLIGKSGSFNGPHLHFEVRDFRPGIKLPGSDKDEAVRRAKLVAMSPDELRDMTWRYLNPVRFFVPAIEDYRAGGGRWAAGAQTPSDTDQNGYPDQVMLDAARYQFVVGAPISDPQPVAFHMRSLMAYHRRGDVNFWEVHHG